MFKQVDRSVWAFDVEWVPDPDAGRRLLQLSENLPYAEVVQAMWKAEDASKDEPMPFLKTVICRVVSIAAVVRSLQDDGSVQLHLTLLPHDQLNTDEQQEVWMLSTFLEATGKKKPQLVGFNSQGADLKILVQRAVAKGVQAEGFARHPIKPGRVWIFSTAKTARHIST